jgi:hypothetical protein
MDLGRAQSFGPCYYLKWLKELCKCDSVKDSGNGEMILNYLGGPKVATRILIRK